MNYVGALEYWNIQPNFWCSKDYFEAANIKVENINGVLYPTIGKGVCITPPINIRNGKINTFSDVEIWSDFIQYQDGNKKSTFLDYEYLYDPKAFLNLNGKKWKVFRKNIRKWPGRNPVHYYTKVSNPESIDVFINWLESRNENEEIHGDEEMVWFIENERYKKGVYKNSKVVGINIWDENYKFINFRYSFCSPNEPFLSEYLRYRFYTDPEILKKGKIINDGGVLGNPYLKFFKDRLNPLSTRKVHTWK